MLSVLDFFYNTRRDETAELVGTTIVRALWNWTVGIFDLLTIAYTKFSVEVRDSM